MDNECIKEIYQNSKQELIDIINEIDSVLAASGDYDSSFIYM